MPLLKNKMEIQKPLSQVMNSFSEQLNTYTLEEALKLKGNEVLDKIYQDFTNNQRQDFLNICNEWKLEDNEYRNGYSIFLQLFALSLYTLDEGKKFIYMCNSITDNVGK